MLTISKNALTILKSRYLLKDQKGRCVESPEEMFRRVAVAVASAEQKTNRPEYRKKWEQVFFEAMCSRKFLPNSPTLMNAGTSGNQLSACFVLPVKDSTDEIFKTLHHAALIQKSGGGTGFNFSHLRPENDAVSYPGSKASGPLAFMEIFDTATEHIRQGGKRRGANMGILSVSHPDIEKFIHSKRKEGKFRNFNISVSVPDIFMKAVQKNKNWKLINPRTGKVVRQVKARKLWNDIVHYAHQTGDPGIIFHDAINKYNPTPFLGTIETTNPCGEVPLLHYEPCNLGSINLSLMVTGKKINWALLEDTIFTAVRFLDNVIEINNYILPEIEKMAKGNRKIGLGIMGWADTLIQLNIPYASKKGVKLGEKVMRFIRDKSHRASMELAKERGAFPNWSKSRYYPKYPLRNATLTSIAPTGTISIIAGTSPSIEPLFAIYLDRKHVLEDQTLKEIHPFFSERIISKGKISKAALNKILVTGSLAGIKGISAEMKRIFLTAHEISYEYHLQHQLAFQKYTDNAVSKTINMPRNAREETVKRVFLQAWKKGAKGITIFREGSKKHQVLNKSKANNEIKDNCVTCFNFKPSVKKV